MAYDVPTAAALKARYPVFSAVDDAVVNAAIVDAQSMVDSSWIEADYQPALMLYAAHLMTSDGIGATTEAQLAGFKSLQVGSLSLTRSDNAGAAGELTSTTFGTRFLTYLRRNKAGGAVALGGTQEGRLV